LKFQYGIMMQGFTTTAGNFMSYLSVIWWNTSHYA